MSRGTLLDLSTFSNNDFAAEALLRASLDHNQLSVEKFARWLRAICTIILARNTTTDRTKAIGYVEQALAVIEDHNDGDEVRYKCFHMPCTTADGMMDFNLLQPYPMDERQWLLATSYNTGAECLQSASPGFVIVVTKWLTSLMF